MARKHVKQMSAKERELLKEVIIGLKDLSLTDHCKDRITTKRMTEEEVIKAARQGRIVECHNNVRNDIRILVRHDRKDKTSICAVISLLDLEIVTSYPNSGEDKHYTLDWNEYRWRVDLVQKVKIFLQRQDQRGGVKHSQLLQRVAIL